VPPATVHPISKTKLQNQKNIQQTKYSPLLPMESGRATLQDGIARSDFQWPRKPQGEIRRFSEVKRLIN
jgi:hypothetical protein